MAQVDCYNGDYGTDLSGSVSFEYGTGALNVRRLRWNEDMSNVSNKLWYFVGPRGDRDPPASTGAGTSPGTIPAWTCRSDPPSGDIWQLPGALTPRVGSVRGAHGDPGLRGGSTLCEGAGPLRDLCLGSTQAEILYRQLW